MPRIRIYFVLLTTLTALPAGFVRAEGFTELLTQHDRNGNGLLEAHERAMLSAAQAHQTELASLPVVCEGEPPSGGVAGESASVGRSEDAVAGGSKIENEQPPQQEVASHPQLRWEQIAVQAPPASDQPDQNTEAAAQPAAAEYQPHAPAPPEPPRQVVQIRNAVHYRMMLNEQHAQTRPQSFAQAATFGPMVGRTKRTHFAAAVHDHCGCSRAGFYLAGY